MNGISCNPSGRTLVISTQIYSLEAIKKSAYKFADRTSVNISPGKEHEVLLTFNFRGQDQEQVIADFYNELLDQDLRESIRKETEPLRRLLLAQAFSRTNLAEGT